MPPISRRLTSPVSRSSSIYAYEGSTSSCMDGPCSFPLKPKILVPEFLKILSRLRGIVTNNNGFWIGLLDLLALLLQLQQIISAQNQWLSKTRSIPHWTTSVFSSTATNGERKIPSSASVVRWLTLHSGTLNFSRMNSSLHGSLYSLLVTMENICCLAWLGLTCHGNVLTEPLPNNGLPLWLHYSGFQASCHNTLSKRCWSWRPLSGPMLSRGVSIAMSHCNDETS
jgi:hypothetical protein